MATISDERLAELLVEVNDEMESAVADAEYDQNPQLAIDAVAEFDLAEMRSIVSELQSLRSQAGVSEAVAWQDITPTEYDPDAPPCHSADNAAMFILDALAKQLGLETYTPADGSETWEGDVLGTMHNILVSAGIWDDYNGRLFARPAPIEITEADCEAALEAALKFVQPKLQAIKTEKGLIGVWCQAWRVAWSAALQGETK